ncbi:MAG TPA: hypothetical protein ENN69_05060 [Spirochaetia bacterium]|nr:hypothetical protein [Spirochaetia bacterium]
MSHSLSEEKILLRELAVRLETVTCHFNDYCHLMELGAAAARAGNDEKALSYREQEQSLIAQITAGQKAVRELEDRLSTLDSRSHALDKKKAVSEDRRQRALFLNQTFSTILRERLRLVRDEIRTVGHTLRALPGGKDQSAAEPMFIDIST